MGLIIEGPHPKGLPTIVPMIKGAWWVCLEALLFRKRDGSQKKVSTDSVGWIRGIGVPATSCNIYFPWKWTNVPKNGTSLRGTINFENHQFWGINFIHEI